MRPSVAKAMEGKQVVGLGRIEDQVVELNDLPLLVTPAMFAQTGFTVADPFLQEIERGGDSL